MTKGVTQITNNLSAETFLVNLSRNIKAEDLHGGDVIRDRLRQPWRVVFVDQDEARVFVQAMDGVGPFRNLMAWVDFIEIERWWHVGE